MNEAVKLNAMRNVNYRLDSFGRTIFTDTMLIESIASTVGADPFQDLLWNGGCSNQSC